MTFAEIMGRNPAQRLDVANILKYDDVRAATLELVELVRRHDPHAQYFQMLHLSGRELVDEFWAAPLKLKTLQAIWHAGDHSQAGAWAFCGVGQWFEPIDTADVYAECIAPAAILAPCETPLTFRKLTIDDLGSLSECVAWAANKRFI